MKPFFLERKKVEIKKNFLFFFSLFLSSPLSLAQRRLEHLDQLPALVRLNHDVTPPEERASDVDLREGGPGLKKKEKKKGEFFSDIFFFVEKCRE